MAEAAIAASVANNMAVLPAKSASAIRAQPQSDQRIRHRLEQGQRDHHDDQARLMGVSELAQPPHR